MKVLNQHLKLTMREKESVGAYEDLERPTLDCTRVTVDCGKILTREIANDAGKDSHSNYVKHVNGKWHTKVLMVTKTAKHYVMKILNVISTTNLILHTILTQVFNIVKTRYTWCNDTWDDL